MSLHDDIQNLPDKANDLRAHDAFCRGYRYGHRDARHAAAELALKADAEIEKLRAVLLRCATGIDHLSALARLWEPDYSSGSDRRGWLFAQDAKDDAMKLLAGAALAAPQEPTR